MAIGLIGMGGTIASLGRSPLDIVDYLDHATMLDAASLAERVPNLRTVCDVVPFDFKPKPSLAVQPDDWLELREKILSVFSSELMGIVVTHGTATLEETSYFLDLVIDDPRPIVVTGAVRPIDGISTDGLINLLDAAHVARAPESRDRGVLVVFGGQIHCARYATKYANYSVEAFGSSNGGPVGEVVSSTVRYYARSPKLPKFQCESQSLPRIDIVQSYAGSDGFAIDAAVSKGARGIIISGFPPGDVTPGELAAMRRARSAGIVIVQSSKTARGMVLPRADLAREGFLAAGRLTAHKARILVMVALANSVGIGELSQLLQGA